MAWLLRRLGGLRRVLFGIFILSASFLVFQSFLVQRNPPFNQPRFISQKDPNQLMNNNGTVGEAQAAPTKKLTIPVQTVNTVCGIPKACDSSQLSFNISTRLGDERKPLACLNGLLILDDQKVVKGLNLVLLDEKTKMVKGVHYFDLLTSDSAFIGFMSSEFDGQSILFLASWGDVADKLSTDSREILKKFGSQKISEFKRGTSFVMIGQKGLNPGKALEKIGVITEKETEALVDLKGCLSIPMGEINPDVSLSKDKNPVHQDLKFNPPAVRRMEMVTYGQELPHCGMKDPCPPTAFAFSAYSGKHKDDEPKLCIGNRFVVGRNLNKAGRGMNIVVLNSTANQVIRVAHFDTYQEDSSTLEIFLEQIVVGEVIAVVTFDEASNRLSNMAKQMFYELGSGLIQNIKFRASWYFIGQKGISGFTPFEELNFASGSEWAKPVNVKECIPKKLDGRKVRPDPAVKPKNEAKRIFCKKYDGYEEFCDDSKLDEVLSPSPLFNKSMDGNAIFKVPVLIVAGLSHNSLRFSCETLLRQPGIKPQNVLVAYDENYNEAGALASLFGFKTIGVASQSTYSAHMILSMHTAFQSYPDAKALIVIEEELLLTVDFLNYMASLYAPLLKDPSIISVAAWNENGFEDVSSLTDTVYRIDNSPGLGFMITNDTFQKHIAQKNISQCCENRSWDGWKVDMKGGRASSIVPDVSRVLRRKSDGLSVLEPRLEALFRRDRIYTKQSNLWIAKTEELSEPAYSTAMNASIKAGRALTMAHLTNCVNPSQSFAASSPPTIHPKLPKGTNPKQWFVIYVKQRSNGDFSRMTQIAACFGLYHSEGHPPRGLYKGALRFSYMGRPLVMVGSKSSFYGNKPFSVSPIPPVA